MKNDKQMLEMLKNEFEKSSENANIPLKLQKESIVNMLKNEEHKETDFSVKTGTHKSKIIVIRRMAAAAAMLAVVIVGVLAMRADGVKVVKRDTFYKSYEGTELVKSAQSYKEVEAAVKEILGESEAEPNSVPQNNKPSSQKSENYTVADGEKLLNKLYEGYRNIVAAEKAVSEIGESLYAAGNAYTGADVVSSVSDVDADIVKTNGEYLYIVTTGKNLSTGGMTEQIKIIKAVPANEMRVVSTVTLSDKVVAGAAEECIEIYLKDNILIALLGRKDFATETETAAVYYDISNPEKPVKIREHTQEGKYLFSSLNENSLCLVTDKQVAASDTGLVPSFGIDGKITNLDAEDIFISVQDPEASYIFITVTDISDFSKPVGRLAILGSGKQLYCSERAITAAREFVSVEADENGAYPSLTEICRFNINGASIVFAGSYVVEGSLLGGISVNDENGYLVAATSVADSSNIYVFDKNMNFISGLQKIFPQKKVDGFKLIGNKGYVACGDETMIIDLSSPKLPKVAGTIPSKLFTGNLYEISETKLLGISSNSDGSATFRLFDVSDSENPFVAAEYTLAKNYFPLSSADSRSVMVEPDMGIFGVPVVISDNETGSEVSAYMMFDVSGGKITPAGSCRHAESYVGDAAVRATCVDGTVYTVSGKNIVAFTAEKWEKTAVCEIR
ncbi:MAG: beta-propeller domain-containing protein [Clostridia bacterium]|nr:beta-propeller domain-containing protein [Clostridia bacterium]